MNFYKEVLEDLREECKVDKNVSLKDAIHNYNINRGVK